MIARSASVADPRWSPDGTRLAWVASHDGRSDLLVAASDGSTPPTVVSADTGIGGGYAWASDEELVVAASDGRLVVLGAHGHVVRVLSREGRAAAPAVSARGDVAFAVEHDDACDVAVVPIDGSQWPARQSHSDYAWDPSWSPDGRRLAWHEWDLPDMPWDASRIVVREHRGRGDGAGKVVAGGDAIAVGQPRFAPSGGRIAFISDAEGWPVVWSSDADGGNAQPVLREQREHAEPAWAAGQRSFSWSPDGEQIAWCRNEDGFGRLMIATPGARSARRALEGLASRAAVERQRHHVCPLGRGDARTGRRARRERLRPPDDRARSRRRLRADTARRTARRHLPLGQCDRARAGVPAGGGHPSAARPASPRRADGPGGRRLERTSAMARATRLRRDATERARLDRVTAARTPKP